MHISYQIIMDDILHINIFRILKRMDHHIPKYLPKKPIVMHDTNAAHKGTVYIFILFLFLFYHTLDIILM